MARRSRRGSALPHARYGVDLAKVPDMDVEPFAAYRSWGWSAEGVASLNGAPWTPKVAFEATCHYRDDWKWLVASATTDETRKWMQSKEHYVPNENCTCGMYAGINMRHLIDIGYIQRGIHGEVSLWGRLERNTLGWRAQFAYPKFFVVPANMIPFDITEAKRRFDMLTEFDVDVYLQPDREARVGQERIPLWVKDFGYSQQGLSWLVEKRKQWYGNKVIPPLAVGDRVAVLGGANGGGIGIVTKIVGDEVYYTMFTLNVVYRKKVKDVKWNEKNWRWETTGTGVMRKLGQATGR
ncbi:MAG: hypothetical protein WA765_12105 [Candidatus Acidiferrum sp.]